jgi:hypothetical protein
VGFIKPLVIDDVNGKIIGCADMPVIYDDDGDLVGVAHPVVVIDGDGKVLGTLIPQVNVNEGVQSVVIYPSEGHMTIPMQQVVAKGTAQNVNVKLPKITVASAQNSNTAPATNQQTNAGEQYSDLSLSNQQIQRAGRQTTEQLEVQQSTNKYLGEQRS